MTSETFFNKLGIVAVALVIGLAANFIVQKFNPTYVSDKFGRRVGYRAMVSLVFVLILAVVVGVAMLFS